MKYTYIFFTSDNSFAYTGGICKETEYHGFSIEIKNGTPAMETLEGFGIFRDVERCKGLTDLYCYIEDNKKYAKRPETLTALERLQKNIVKSIEKELAA